MTVCRFNNSRHAAWLALAAGLAACTAPDAPVARAAGPGCVDDGSGFVEAELYGGVAAELDWRNRDTACTGMPRPDGGGARLRFAGRTDDERDLVLIVGVSELERGQTGNGFAANVTIIDETTSRFYSNGGAPNCWSDIFRQADLDANRSRIDGVVYCSGALAGLSADESIRLRDLRFRGQIDWTAEDSDAPR